MIDIKDFIKVLSQTQLSQIFEASTKLVLPVLGLQNQWIVKYEWQKYKNCIIEQTYNQYISEKRLTDLCILTHTAEKGNF
jgi:hypothetical protein